MAESALDESARATHLANTLRIEDVPAKLRCGMCNKLAVDAVKLLCCSVSICEPCSHDIPETCSICTHSPTSPDDCTPDKKLRSTVRAFIRTEEKKRSKLAGAPPVQDPTPMPAPSETPVPAGDVGAAVSYGGAINADNDDTAQPAEPVEATAGAADNDAQDEQIVDTTKTTADADQEEEEEDDDDDVVITTERPELEEEQPAEDQYHDPEYDGDYSGQQYGGQTNGGQANNFGQGQQGYGNMNGFNPMMGMQNGMGMGNFGMGMPNMMSMAGMGGMGGMNLDPSMMFSNGGFGGMGDMGSMMNMGMGGMNGMGGFGGMQGMNMNMGGGSGGFYGSGNSGGYNHQQQYGNQPHAFPNNQRGYYPRGRGGFGRGRGGFFPRGRGGGFNQYNSFSGGQNQSYGGNQQYSQGYQPSNNNYQQQEDYRRGSPTYDTPNKATQQENKGEGADTNEAAPGATNLTEEQQYDDDQGGGGAQPAGDAADGAGATNTMEVDAVTHDAGPGQDDQSTHQQGVGYEPARGGLGAHGGAYGNVTTIGGESEPPPAPPVNAPKGPKAMRQGLPNSGRFSRPQQPSVPPPAIYSQRIAKPQDHNDHAAHDGGARTRSRSPSRHEVRRDRERTPLEDRESDEAYAERKEREREKRKRKERESRDGREKYEEDANGDERSEKAKSRSDSLDDHERRKHRDRHDDRRSSRRDRSHERRKHRDRSRSPDKANSIHDESSDRSRRKSKSHRVRDELDDRDRAKDRHGSRKHSRRDEDYEYDNKDRSKHSRSSKDDGRARDRERDRRQATPEPVEDLGISIKGAAQNKKMSLDKSMGPPSAPRSSRDDRRGSTRGGDSTPATPITPAEDQYAADREEQIRKRLAKHSNSLGKRTSRDEEDMPSSHDEHRGSRSKRQRQDTRRHSARFE